MLNELNEDAVAGDPISGSKWTFRSIRLLSRALRRRGFKVSYVTVGRLLEDHHFSLRTNRKRLAGVRDKNRNRQFHHIAKLRRRSLKRGLPVIAVDTKKKEMVGNFKNRGRSWRKKPIDVLDHDFPSWAKGRAIPYGIYDIAHNDGYVVVGVSHETPSFAVTAIRRWWIVVGRKRYPKARRLLIEADCGGANGPRRWEWKVALQRFADEFDLVITVTHYPPGASKWLPIDHRMFSLISANWAGEPLKTYEVILKRIRTTRSATGFRCRACLDKKEYLTKVKVTPAEREHLRLVPRRKLPQWNYKVRPNNDR